jgi:hypothetical protein
MYRYNQFDALEYGTVVAISAVIAVFGFLWGLGFGLGAVSLAFIVQSSKQQSVLSSLSGVVVKSNMHRTKSQKKKLTKFCARHRVCVIQLQVPFRIEYRYSIQCCVIIVLKSILLLCLGVQKADALFECVLNCER